MAAAQAQPCAYRPSFATPPDRSAPAHKGPIVFPPPDAMRGPLNLFLKIPDTRMTSNNGFPSFYWHLIFCEHLNGPAQVTIKSQPVPPLRR
ncbi:jg14677 [Pararge aegeria aegeria]|uniref:Jg14677 protein n=1 Tax=Pararge aegeria aegeria TaxID=348720 RepID=A0A8S4R9P4_9NEOP|nr:jg14677 [Pararge aegeria aegeria]